MNILYISRIFGCPWGGPTHSVPAQISAQSKHDNVMWYNIVDPAKSEWKETLIKWKSFDYYNDFDNYPEETIHGLPEPFNKPDLVIIEQFYKFAKSKIVQELMRDNHKYVIIPRGELAVNAQKQKKLKKTIFNLLYFNKFAKNAVAIQYLTERESRDSTSKWNTTSLVIPNGTDVPDIHINNVATKQVTVVSIGRFSIFHKGIDLLIDACILVKHELLRNNCKIIMYGPDEEGALPSILKRLSDSELTEVLEFRGPVNGNEKKEVLLCANAFIMTSRFEGHPTGLLEALSYGLPSLVTTGSNMRTEVETYEAGWGADNNAESIAAAMKKMLSEKSKYKEMSKNAINLAKKYSWDAIAQKSHIEYEKLLGESNLTQGR